MWHLVGFSYPHWITMHGQPHIRYFLFSATVHHYSGSQLVSHPIDTEVKQPGCAADHSSLSLSLSLLLRVRMDGAIPLFLLFVSMTWARATVTVLGEDEVTRNYVIRTAGFQPITTKKWIQQQGIWIESLTEKEVSLFDCVNFPHLNNSHNVSHLSITAKCYWQ